jgi:hypothetical protein
VAAASVALAAPTSTHSGGANANQIGIVRIDPNNPMAAYVTGNYTCPAGAQAHLFVSVKQVASGKPDNRLKEEGSSQYTSAWLETHPAPDTFTCDGTWHQGTWRITDDPLDPSYGLFAMSSAATHPRHGLRAVLLGRRQREQRLARVQRAVRPGGYDRSQTAPGLAGRPF